MTIFYTVIASSSCGLIFSLHLHLAGIIVSAVCFLVLLMLIMWLILNQKNIEKRRKCILKLCDEFNEKYLAKDYPHCKLSISKYQSYIVLEDKNLVQPGMNIISFMNNPQNSNKNIEDCLGQRRSTDVIRSPNVQPQAQYKHDLRKSVASPEYRRLDSNKVFDFRDKSLTQDLLLDQEKAQMDFDDMSIPSIGKTKKTNDAQFKVKKFNSAYETNDYELNGKKCVTESTDYLDI